MIGVIKFETSLSFFYLPHQSWGLCCRSPPQHSVVCQQSKPGSSALKWQQWAPDRSRWSLACCAPSSQSPSGCEQRSCSSPFSLWRPPRWGCSCFSYQPRVVRKLSEAGVTFYLLKHVAKVVEVIVQLIVKINIFCFFLRLGFCFIQISHRELWFKVTFDWS